nr:hypothetical protein [Tanacetum cinerariifolium]GEX15334.1 hypothetical protein [Tanacetum cinerariifolium]
MTTLKLPSLIGIRSISKGMKNYQYWLLVAPSGWSFGFVVPSQMTHLVASITLDSARTYVMQVVLVIVDMIIGIVVVVVGAPSIIKLVFMITGVSLGPVFLLRLLVFAMVAAYASSAAVTLLATNFLMES